MGARACRDRLEALGEVQVVPPLRGTMLTIGAGRSPNRGYASSSKLIEGSFPIEARIAAQEKCRPHPGIMDGERSENFFESRNQAVLPELPGRIGVSSAPDTETDELASAATLVDGLA